MDTSSIEVFGLAQRWISKCSCADFWNKPGRKWYPRRLLDLEGLHSTNRLTEGADSIFVSKCADLDRRKVKLVEINDQTAIELSQRANNRYVTLSHCWGKPKSPQGQLKLTTLTEEVFKTEGIELRELAKSFREAIIFAHSLPDVGYIWIDSLCIKQRSTDLDVDPKDSEIDWLEQSRVMDKVYRKSYLNISATAAVDSDQGLFFPHQPDNLWEEEINLNVTGLISTEYGKTIRTRVDRIYDTSTKDENDGGTDHKHHSNANVSIGTVSPRNLHTTPSDSTYEEQRIGSDYLKRCAIVDVSLWDNLVEQAPVNKRGWVLQERVMSPRIVHFCNNQIAWECSEFQDAEAHVEGFPMLRTRLGDVVAEGKPKSLTETEGLRIRELRLKGFPDPDQNMKNLYIFELWKRMVEVYSRLALTVSRDKLAALSGITRQFQKRTQCKYIAGMWEDCLESQLLWHVDEVFKDGNFINKSRRNASRAPSFSWATLDTPNGIVYGETTDYGNNRANELLFRVQGVYLKYIDQQNEFGLIEGRSSYIVLKPRHLRQIELRKLQHSKGVAYSWRLKLSNSKGAPADHYNLYLDAPETDMSIFHSDTGIYCMPAAYGERTVRQSARYLYCLILRLDITIKGVMHFRRVGLTKLSEWMEKEGQQALMAVNFDRDMWIW